MTRCGPRSADSTAHWPESGPTTSPRTRSRPRSNGNPHLDGGAIDEVIFGNANDAGEDNRNLGRMAGLLTGLPVTVPATTVNRLCGSSLDAAMIASRSIETTLGGNGRMHSPIAPIGSRTKHGKTASTTTSSLESRR